MDPQGSHDVTLILQSLRQGDEAGLERILPIVYGELQNIARRQMAKEKAGHKTVHRGAWGLSNRGGIEPGGGRHRTGAWRAAEPSARAAATCGPLFGGTCGHGPRLGGPAPPGLESLGTNAARPAF